MGVEEAQRDPFAFVYVVGRAYLLSDDHKIVSTISGFVCLFVMKCP